MNYGNILVEHNEFVLSGRAPFSFGCANNDAMHNTVTNVAVINNVIRYHDWALHAPRWPGDTYIGSCIRRRSPPNSSALEAVGCFSLLRTRQDRLHCYAGFYTLEARMRSSITISKRSRSTQGREG